MKKIKIFLMTLCLVLICTSQVWSVGTVTVNYNQLSATEHILTLSWVGDASNGLVPAYTVPTWITNELQPYYIFMVCTVPGATAPTALYDITLVDGINIDMMGGVLANRSNSATECVVPVIDIAHSVGAGRPIYGGMTLNLTGNSVNSATGTIIIFLFK
jgi:hypothetical protein